MTSFLAYLLLKAFSFFVNLLPEGFALWLGRQLGNVWYHLDFEHRNVAIQNLQMAFGHEKSVSEIRDIARRTFQNLGMTGMEFFRIPRMDVKTFKERVKIEGLEEALKLFQKGKGIFLLLSHFGNWEMMGVMSKVIGQPIMVLAKPMKRKELLDEWIGKIRSASGLEVISAVNAGRKVIRALSQNRVVGILIDQRAKRSEGIWADFFGKKAPTTPGLAVLAMKTGAPVLPVFMVRDGFQGHRLIIKEPLELIRTGDIKRDVEANTQLFNRTLESMIRQYPDQWFWVHRRWERKARVYHR
ncbi:MAG TPA: lysophospholipid acyltransferase family protein [Thermodesulfobacteriota bacterium]|nr:lysophospholipid acyltransferase family protein [Thermodesulfobacteriota bacterium]